MALNVKQNHEIPTMSIDTVTIQEELEKFQETAHQFLGQPQQQPPILGQPIDLVQVHKDHLNNIINVHSDRRHHNVGVDAYFTSSFGQSPLLSGQEAPEVPFDYRFQNTQPVVQLKHGPIIHRVPDDTINRQMFQNDLRGILGERIQVKSKYPSLNFTCVDQNGARTASQLSSKRGGTTMLQKTVGTATQTMKRRKASSPAIGMRQRLKSYQEVVKGGKNRYMHKFHPLKKDNASARSGGPKQQADEKPSIQVILNQNSNIFINGDQKQDKGINSNIATQTAEIMDSFGTSASHRGGQTPVGQNPPGYSGTAHFGGEKQEAYRLNVSQRFDQSPANPNLMKFMQAKQIHPQLIVTKFDEKGRAQTPSQGRLRDSSGGQQPKQTKITIQEIKLDSFPQPELMSNSVIQKKLSEVYEKSRPQTQQAMYQGSQFNSNPSSSTQSFRESAKQTKVVKRIVFQGTGTRHSATMKSVGNYTYFPNQPQGQQQAHPLQHQESSHNLSRRAMKLKELAKFRMNYDQQQMISDLEQSQSTSKRGKDIQQQAQQQCNILSINYDAYNDNYGVDSLAKTKKKRASTSQQNIRFRKRPQSRQSQEPPALIAQRAQTEKEEAGGIKALLNQKSIAKLGILVEKQFHAEKKIQEYERHQAALAPLQQQYESQSQPDDLSLMGKQKTINIDQSDDLALEEPTLPGSQFQTSLVEDGSVLVEQPASGAQSNPITSQISSVRIHLKPTLKHPTAAASNPQSYQSPKQAATATSQKSSNVKKPQRIASQYQSSLNVESRPQSNYGANQGVQGKRGMLISKPISLSSRPMSSVSREKARLGQTDRNRPSSRSQMRGSTRPQSSKKVLSKDLQSVSSHKLLMQFFPQKQPLASSQRDKRSQSPANQSKSNQSQKILERHKKMDEIMGIRTDLGFIMPATTPSSAKKTSKSLKSSFDNKRPIKQYKFYPQEDNYQLILQQNENYQQPPSSKDGAAKRSQLIFQSRRISTRNSKIQGLRQKLNKRDESQTRDSAEDFTIKGTNAVSSSGNKEKLSEEAKINKNLLYLDSSNMSEYQTSQGITIKNPDASLKGKMLNVVINNFGGHDDSGSFKLRKKKHSRKTSKQSSQRF